MAAKKHAAQAPAATKRAPTKKAAPQPSQFGPSVPTEKYEVDLSQYRGRARPAPLPQRIPATPPTE